MSPDDTPEAVRGPLQALADAIGGSWALFEVSEAHALSIGATQGFPADAGFASLPRVVVEGGSRDFGPDGSVVVRVGLGRRSHPAGRGSLVERVLVGTDLPDGNPERQTFALLEIILGGLSFIADAATHADAERRRVRQLELRASTDPLTGLLNRRGWDHLMGVEEERCARHGLPAEIAVVDLDGLKAINDSTGHEAGDALIVRAATFIFSAVRDRDAAARLGGDEFAVMAVGAPSTAPTVGARIEQALAEAGIKASVGSANRAEAGSLADAWRAADLRMYRVKQRRRKPSIHAPGVETQPLT